MFRNFFPVIILLVLVAFPVLAKKKLTLNERIEASLERNVKNRFYIGDGIVVSVIDANAPLVSISRQQLIVRCKMNASSSVSQIDYFLWVSFKTDKNNRLRRIKTWTDKKLPDQVLAVTENVVFEVSLAVRGFKFPVKRKLEKQPLQAHMTAGIFNCHKKKANIRFYSGEKMVAEIRNARPRAISSVKLQCVYPLKVVKGLVLRSGVEVELFKFPCKPGMVLKHLTCHK